MLFDDNHYEPGLDASLSRLCNSVSRNHPAGYDAIIARWTADRRAAGQDGEAMAAMHTRWRELEAEAHAHLESEHQKQREAIARNTREEGRRVALNHWREKLPAVALLRSLTRSLTDASRLVGVNDDEAYGANLDAIVATLKVGINELQANRREVRTRIAAARAAEAVEAFAPKIDNVAP